MKSTGRTLGVFLLALALTLALVLIPGMSLTAYAYDGNPYASLVNQITDVTFDGKTWYIIEDNSTAVNAGTVTLLAKECVAESQYNASGFVAYESNPTVKTAVDNWYDDNITADAKTAVSGGGMFLLTEEEANAITNAEVRKDATAAGDGWWLCSQGIDDDFAAYVDGTYGNVNTYVTWGTLGVRPALKLNLASVIFSSQSNTFTLKPSHTHSFTYSASGATITATCTAEGCDLPPSTEGGTDHVATLTIAAPLHTVAGDGKAAAAVITDADSIQGTATVKYYTKSGETYEGETETAPTDAGEYKASITLGTATASVEYRIAVSYPVWVLGKQVTELNKDDVLGDADQGATVIYTPATTTTPAAPAKLTLNGAEITSTGSEDSYDGAAIAAEGNLTIDVTGTNTVTGPDNDSGSSGGIAVDGNVTVTGSGTLTATGGTATNDTSYGIFANGSVTVSGTLIATGGTAAGDLFGNPGVYASGAVTVAEGGTLIATGGKATGDYGESSGVSAHQGSVIVAEGGTLTATGGEATGQDGVSARRQGKMASATALMQA